MKSSRVSSGLCSIAAQPAAKRRREKGQRRRKLTREERGRRPLDHTAPAAASWCVVPVRDDARMDVRAAGLGSNEVVHELLAVVDRRPSQADEARAATALSEPLARMARLRRQPN